MIDIENKVLSWHGETFPNATIDAIDDKFDEELVEFIESMKQIDIEEEFSDMCIVFMARQNKLGRRTLTQCIADKLAVNKARKWGPEEADGNRKKVD